VDEESSRPREPLRLRRRHPWLCVAAVLAGSILTLKAVWSFADIANGLMAVPNLIALLALNRVIVEETRRQLWQAKR
jgi:AGCS family alanine or glycine:cation symporter